MVTKKKKVSETKDLIPGHPDRALRDTAEEQLARAPPTRDLKKQTPEQLVHDLQVHQIEIELQAEELRKARFELEESRDKYLDLYEFAPTGYLTLDDKAVIAGVNLTGATLLGIERAKLLNARFRKFVARTDLEQWDRYFVNVQKQEEKQVSVITLNRDDGSTFPARLESIRMIDSSGGNLLITLAFSDISDIRLAEERLKNQYSLQKSIVESTDAAVYSLDRQYRYTSFNSHHAMMMKVLYDADIELGKSIFDYQSVGEDQLRTQFNINRALAGELFTEQSFSGEETRSRRYFEVTHRPVKDGGNAIIGVAVFAQDITDRKEAEDALKESEERYRRITEGLTDYLYTVRVQGGRAVSTTHGAACVAVTGYTAGEFAADPHLWIHMVFEEDRNRIIRHISEIMSGKSVPPIEHRIVRKDGQVRWVRDTPVLQFDAQGRLVSYDGVIKDITVNKQAEETVRESEVRVRQKLESLLAPEGDIGSLELGDIIDTAEIQSIMNDFFALTHIGIGIIDLHGKILVATGWQDICTQFHRMNPQSCANCIESDKSLSSGVAPGTFRLYRCKNNMWDIVTPITLGNTHMGNLFLGQFLFDDETVDLEVFRAQAGRYGFDEGSYLAALERVPRWNRTTVDTVMTLYTKFARVISELSYRNLTLARIVNERDRLLTSLQVSEEKFRTVIEFAPVGFYLTDKQGTCTFVNKEWSRISGLTAEEAKGSGWINGLHPDDQKKIADSWERMVQSHGSWGLEYRFLPKGRDPIDVYGTATALHDEKGNITGYIGANIDITGRKRQHEELTQKHEELVASYKHLAASEEQLKARFEELRRMQTEIRESEERFRLTMEATSDGLWDWNIKKHTTFFSPHWYTMLGYEPGEMPASHATWRALVHPEDLGPAERKMKDHIRTHVGYSVEVRMRTKPGGWRWILSRGRVVEQDKEGNPVRVIGTHTDITDRKVAEEVSRDAKEYAEKLIQTANVMIIGLDNRGKIITFNQAAETITGYTSDEMAGRNWFEVIVPKDRYPRVWEEFNRLLAGGIPEHFENPVLTKSGEERYIIWKNSEIRNKGQISGIIAFGIDITDRRKAEEQLNKTVDKLTRFNLLTVDREQGMKALKQEINDLLKNSGQPEKYRIDP